MKALRFSESGPPFVLTLRQMSTPEPVPGQVP